MEGCSDLPTMLIIPGKRVTCRGLATKDPALRNVFTRFIIGKPNNPSALSALFYMLARTMLMYLLRVGIHISRMSAASFSEVNLISSIASARSSRALFDKSFHQLCFLMLVRASQTRVNLF